MNVVFESLKIQSIINFSLKFLTKNVFIFLLNNRNAVGLKENIILLVITLQWHQHEHYFNNHTELRHNGVLTNCQIFQRYNNGLLTSMILISIKMSYLNRLNSSSSSVIIVIIIIIIILITVIIIIIIIIITVCHLQTSQSQVYSKWDVIHSMLWPGLVVFICVILFLRHETKRRRLTFCGRQEEEEFTEGPGSHPPCRMPSFRHDLYPVSTTLTLLDQTRGIGYGSVVCDLSKPPKRYSEQLCSLQHVDHHRHSLQHQAFPHVQHHTLPRHFLSSKNSTNDKHHHHQHHNHQQQQQQCHHLLSILQPLKSSQEKLGVEPGDSNRRQLQHQDSELSTTPSQSADQSEGDKTKLLKEYKNRSGKDWPNGQRSHEDDSTLSSLENIGDTLKRKRRSSAGNLPLLLIQLGREEKPEKKKKEQKFQSFHVLPMFVWRLCDVCVMFVWSKN